MLELLSLVFGGLLRFAPEVLGYFRAKRDHEHELAMTRLQLDIDKARAQQALDLAHTNAAIAMDQAEMQGLIEAVRAQATPTGVRWVDAVSATVRPFLTYWWAVILYTAGKVITLVVAIDSGATLAQLVPVVVTDFDRAVIGSMFSFWFLDRSLRKAGRS